MPAESVPAGSTTGLPLDAASRLALVARFLNADNSVADIVETVLTQGMAMLGADGAVFAIEQGDRLLPISVHGASQDIVADLGPISAGAVVPIAEAARDRTAIWLSDRDTTAARFPKLREVAPDVSAWAALPVELDGALVGVFGFCFRRDQHFDEINRLYVRMLADISARPIAAALDAPTHRPQDRHRDEVRIAALIDIPGTPSELAGRLLADGLLGPHATGVVIAGRLVADELWFLATAGQLGDVHSNRTVHLRIDHHAPLPAAASTARPVALRTRADITNGYPEFAAMVPDAEAAIALPALYRGASIGSFGIIFGAPQEFDPDTVTILAAVADAIAARWLAPLVA